DSKGEYTAYIMQGLKEGQATIRATYEDKTAEATLDVYTLELDIEPKDAEVYVNTEYYIPDVTLISSKPDVSDEKIDPQDENLKLTFEPSDVVEVIAPGIYRGLRDEVVQVK